MRDIDAQEVAQVSGGARWSITPSDVLDAIYGDRQHPGDTPWVNTNTVPANNAGMGEFIGDFIIYTALTIGALGLGLFSRLRN